MSFLENIPVHSNGISLDAYRDQQLIAANRDAAEAFDEQLKQKVKIKLEELNHSFTSDADFITFVNTRTKVLQVAGSETYLICLDSVIVDDAVSDYGTKLAEYYGSGYNVVIPELTFHVDPIN